MTQLTNQTPASTYGDLLTTTNGGNGLTNVLQNVQDGFGNNSPMQIATNAVNFLAGSLQLASVAITTSATNINQSTQPNPVFSGTGSITVTVGTTAQRPGAPMVGMLRFNTDLSALEYFNGAAWVNV